MWREPSNTGAQAGTGYGDRLRQVTDRWRIPTAPAEPDVDSDRPVATAWTGSAVRGLALLLVVLVAVAAYWAWSGRPREVEAAPALATAPVAPASNAQPAPVAASAGSVPTGSAPVGSGPAEVAPDSVGDPAPSVVVHVAGDVRRPGLVVLVSGARVADAIAAAGGVTRPRAADTVNLARVVVDGEQILVGSPAGVMGAGAAGPVAAPVTVIDLNAADAAALDGLPGIGPVLAERIVAWRSANGRFRSVDELGEVSGIGASILSQIRSRVRV